jgi:hypothetical protein
MHSSVRGSGQESHILPHPRRFRKGSGTNSGCPSGRFGVNAHDLFALLLPEFMLLATIERIAIPVRIAARRTDGVLFGESSAVRNCHRKY